jgi:hypothetical protein
MTQLSDTQFAEQCRRYRLSGFMELADLLGNDLAAAKAIRAEAEFTVTEEWKALKAPNTSAFAKSVREFMASGKLPWNSENLLAACKQVLSSEETRKAS